MHVPISEVHVQWHFSMSLNSQCILQFYPTVMLMAYVNSCFIIICQKVFPVIFSSRISYNSCTTASVDMIFFHKNRLCAWIVRSYKLERILLYRQEFMFQMCFHDNKREWMDFLLKNSIIYVCNVLLVRNIWTKKITKINDIISLIY